MERCRRPLSHAATRSPNLGLQSLRHLTVMSRRRRRRGIALLWTAIFGLVLIALTGLSLDWGKVAYNVHELQNAADAAALAGAQWVKVDQVVTRDRAQQLALANPTEKIPVQIARNEANAELGDLVIGRWEKLTRTFTPTLENPNAVRVVARRITDGLDGPVALIFGHLAGMNTANITRQAIAHSTGSTGAGLICLDPNENLGLKIHGNVILDVEGGDIMVNSSADPGATISGTAGFTDCDLFKVVGDYKLNGVTEDELPFTFMDHEDEVEPIPDPLAALDPPSIYDAANWPWPELSLTKNGKPVPDTGPRLDASGNPVPFEPGLYSGGFAFTTAAQTVEFNPGIYVVGGAGLQMNGGVLRAEGVLFYLASGPVDFGGGGTVLMSPPGDSFAYPAWQQAMAEYYKDVTIFQARDNHSQARLIGTSAYDIGGILYFPRNGLKLEGTAGNTFRAGDQLICWTADIGGSGVLEIDYQGDNLIAGFRSVLVR